MRIYSKWIPELDDFNNDYDRVEHFHLACGEQARVKLTHFCLFILLSITILKILKHHDMLGSSSILGLFLLYITLGLFAYLGSTWLHMIPIRRSLREHLIMKGIPTCMDCGYCLRGISTAKCPECGNKIGFLSAIAQGNIELVNLHLDEGADVNQYNRYNVTPLHIAIISGYKSIVELLVNKGADVNSETEKELTPLELAKKVGHHEISQFLKKHGAKP